MAGSGVPPPPPSPLPAEAAGGSLPPPASLEALSAEQEAAVGAGARTVRVLAGPGAGKTRVLAARVAHLVRERGVPPYNVLAITFTNRAAGELRERLALVLGEGAANLVTAGTFHSVCGRILRRELGSFPPAGRTGAFTISDKSEGVAIIKRFFKGGYRHSSSKEASKEAASALGLISLAKGSVETGFGMTGAGAVAALEGLGRSAPGYFPALFEHYERALRAANLLDFDDMISLTVAVLQEAEGAQERARKRFRHILVDEFQDTNAPQYALVQLLTGHGERQAGLFVVGDADQAIYGWRGADVSIIRDRFLRDFGDSCTTVQLSQNYRSVPAVLDAAAKVLTESSVDSELELESLRTGVPGGVELLSAKDEVLEAEQIARTLVGAMHSGKVGSLSECAVLYRTNAQSRLIEEAMVKAGLPYALVGRTPFWDRQVVMDVMSYLKLIANPADDTSLRRIINVPARGISKTTVDLVSDWAASQGFDSLAAGCRALEQKVRGEGAGAQGEAGGAEGEGVNAEELGLTARQWKAVSGFLSLMGALRAHARESAPEEVLDAVLMKTGYMELLQKKSEKISAEAEHKGSATDEDLVGELRNAIAIHASQAAGSSRPSGLVTESRAEGQLVVTDDLAGQGEDRATVGLPALLLFLQEAALVSSSDEAEEEREGREAVRLMTLHACKGLEYNLVIISGCEEGLLPHGFSGSGESEEDLQRFDEECRLCYVGATRAKQFLFLSHAENRRTFGRPSQPRKLSRFITAMGFEDPGATRAADTYKGDWRRQKGTQRRKHGSRHAARFGINDFGEADSVPEDDSWSRSGYGRPSSGPKMEVIIDSGPSPLEGSRLTRRPRARRGNVTPDPPIRELGRQQSPREPPRAAAEQTQPSRAAGAPAHQVPPGAPAPRGKSGEFTSTIKGMSVAPPRRKARSSSSRRPAGKGRSGPGRGRRRYADLLEDDSADAPTPETEPKSDRPRPLRSRPPAP